MLGSGRKGLSVETVQEKVCSACDNSFFFNKELLVKNTVLVNLSNRHIHLSQEDVEILFGKGHQLTRTKDLMQPGQFACNECVTVVCDKGKLANVRVLGPTRKETQLEILQSDAVKLTTQKVPTRESGKLAGSATFELVGPAGSVKKDQGMIIAMRHIHLDPKTAEEMGLADNEVVSIRVGVPGREVVFESVVARVSASYAAECHIDFDEGNACGIGNGTQAVVMKKNA